MVTDALESGFKKRSQLLKWCTEANRMKFNTDNRYKHMYVYVYLYICVYIYMCVCIYIPSYLKNVNQQHKYRVLGTWVIYLKKACSFSDHILYKPKV